MRVLLALDSCLRTAAAALELTRRYEAELTVLFVLDATWNVYVGHDWLSGSGSRADFLDWIKKEELDAANAALAAFRALAGEWPYEEKTRAGNVREEILKECREGYDLLIMADPFARGLEIMRNTSAEIAGKTPCSLLLVKR